MKALDIFAEGSARLSIPVDIITQKSAILARTGAGKSTAAAAIVEEVLDAKQQVIVLDPKGDWWGLRSSASGEAVGYDVPVFGGSSPARTVEIEPGSGGLIATEAAAGLSMVIDLSEFSNSERNRFVTDFAEAFYRAKSEHNDPVLLVLEEADEVVPQRVDSGNARMVGAIERIVKRGRFRGIGTLLITQRSASLNKDVLTQTEVLIVMQTTSPQDRKAIDGWVEHHPDTEKLTALREGMSALKQGEAFIWSPSWLEVFARVKFRMRRTYDAGRTPRVGERRSPPKVLADIDIAKLGERIKATAEQLKAKDPAELRRKIARLEAELAKKPQAAKPEIQKVPYFNDEERELLRTAVRMGPKLVMEAHQAAGRLEEWTEEVTKLVARIESVRSAASSGSHDGAAVRAAAPAANLHRPSTGTPSPVRVEAPVRSGEPRDTNIKRPQQKVLDALAWREQVALQGDTPKKMLAALAGYTWSGGFRNILSDLKSAGLIEYVGTEGARLTDAGRRSANHVSMPASNEEAHDAARRKVKSPALWATLAAVINAYPNDIGKEELAERVGKAWSGGFRNELSKLRRLGFIDYPSNGTVRAQAVLFPEDVQRV